MTMDNTASHKYQQTSTNNKKKHRKMTQKPIKNRKNTTKKECVFIVFVWEKRSTHFPPYPILYKTKKPATQAIDPQTMKQRRQTHTQKKRKCQSTRKTKAKKEHWIPSEKRSTRHLNSNKNKTTKKKARQGRLNQSKKHHCTINFFF
jgi:hypothetical protein